MSESATPEFAAVAGDPPAAAAARQAVQVRIGALATRLGLDLPDADPPLASERLDAASERALQALLNGELERALTLYAALLSAEPEEPAHHFGFGLCLQQRGDPEAAGRYYLAALALDPADAAAAFRVAECLAASGAVDAAREAVEMALALCQLPQTDPALRPWIETLRDRLA